MTMNNKQWLRYAIAGLFGAAMTVEVAIAANSPAPVKSAIGEQAKAEESGRTSQKRIDEMDDAASGLVAGYRAALAETSSLKAYNDQLATQVGSQQEEMASLAKQLGEIEKTSREVTPLISDMLATLEQFVTLDTPFLADERAKRIAGLKEMMARADVSVSEKFRRVVEAYQVESEYGRTVEAYEGKVGDKTVNFLRAGRVSLMYQTLDAKETGYWNADQRSWVADNRYDADMKAALKVARKQAAPDFLVVPVHAPVEVK